MHTTLIASRMKDNRSMEFNDSSAITTLRTTIVDAIESFTSNASTANASTANVPAKVPLVYGSWFPRPSPWTLAPILILIVCCLLFNLTIVVVIASQRSLHKPANAYICSLACLDFVDGCIPMVAAAIGSVFPEYRVPTTFCLISMLSELIVKAAALNHLLLLAYDRYCAVVNPLKYSMPNRKLSIAVQIAGAYVVTLIAWVPPAAIFTRVADGGFCYLDLPLNYIFVYFIVTTIVGYSAFVYFYARCSWVIRTQFFKVRPTRGTGDVGGRIKVKGPDLPKTNTSSLANRNNTVEFSIQDEDATTVTTGIGTSGQVETLPASCSSVLATGPARIQKRGTSDQANKRRKDIARSLRNVGVYVLVFSALYMPYVAVRIISQICYMSKTICITDVAYYSVSAWLLYAHSSVHPALYMATQREFRVSLRALVRKLRKLVCR